MNHQYIERVVDLTEPSANRIYNMSVEEARQRILHGTAQSVREIDGSFAILARDGKTVRLARSLDRPMRYFLAKRAAGPALIVADRMDAILEQLKLEGLDDQFHPSYTRMVPAHYVVEIQLVGCPDPDPVYTRFFEPQPGILPPDLDVIGKVYIGALADEVSRWIQSIPQNEPVGVAFSGGIDSGAVFLTTYHVLKSLGQSPARLKAFTLNMGDGPDIQQAREFLQRLDLGLFLEEIQSDAAQIDLRETIRVTEDYKPLDIECAAMGLALYQGIRQRYPQWCFMLDGDGGDENLKDYPIEVNPELTINSIVNNVMLYQEGWGVGKIKHSLTYSGGLSRSYTRTYAPARRFGFDAFSPFTRPSVIEVAEAIPFKTLTEYDHEKLYALKGEVVARGVQAITGLEMPTFPKRRFQHGALPEENLKQHLPQREIEYRRAFQAIYS
ncbi:MAG TPA: asparagine synthase-related protein [Abditibacteriaceae bacterium]|jgi:asparagine synthase (glutamine-hydrolysing)